MVIVTSEFVCTAGATGTFGPGTTVTSWTY